MGAGMSAARFLRGLLLVVPLVAPRVAFAQEHPWLNEDATAAFGTFAARAEAGAFGPEVEHVVVRERFGAHQARVELLLRDGGRRGFILRPREGAHDAATARYFQVVVDPRLPAGDPRPVAALCDAVFRIDPWHVPLATATTGAAGGRFVGRGRAIVAQVFLCITTLCGFVYVWGARRRTQRRSPA